MKLNRKGYMLVEIIVSFALTFAIMISMINLVLSFKNKNEDIYYEAKYLKDKNLITRNIMDDLSDAVVTEVFYNKISETEQVFDFWIIRDYISTVGANSGRRRIKIIKNTDGTTTIKYEIPTISEDYNENSASVTNYEKTIEPSLNVGEITYSDLNGVFSLTIPINSIYTDEAYDINLVTRRVYSLDLNICLDEVCEGDTKVVHGYPVDAEASNKTIHLNTKIGNGDEMDYYDIYKFLDYKTVVKFNSVKIDGVIVANINKTYYIESDTAIKLYYDPTNKLYEKICLIKDIAGNEGECVDFYVNN